MFDNTLISSVWPLLIGGAGFGCALGVICHFTGLVFAAFKGMVNIFMK